MSPEILFLLARITAALVLYGFLGTLIYWLWRDLTHSRSEGSEVPSAHLVLNKNQQRFPLRSSSEIGRAAGNVIRIQDETISALHARMMYHGGQWWIEDLASRNGTEVNGISVDEPLVVTYGDQIRLGNVTARLESGSVREVDLGTSTIEHPD